MWNRGWAYGGGATFPQRRVWMIGTAGSGAPGYVKRGYDRAMTVQLDIGILDYCGVAERRLELLYGTTERDADPQRTLAEARALGAEF